MDKLSLHGIVPWSVKYSFKGLCKTFYKKYHPGLNLPAVGPIRESIRV